MMYSGAMKTIDELLKDIKIPKSNYETFMSR